MLADTEHTMPFIQTRVPLSQYISLGTYTARTSYTTDHSYAAWHNILTYVLFYLSFLQGAYQKTVAWSLHIQSARQFMNCFLMLYAFLIDQSFVPSMTLVPLFIYLNIEIDFYKNNIKILKSTLLTFQEKKEKE